jgi:hypothetical protein
MGAATAQGPGSCAVDGHVIYLFDHLDLFSDSLVCVGATLRVVAARRDDQTRRLATVKVVLALLCLREAASASLESR